MSQLKIFLYKRTIITLLFVVGLSTIGSTELLGQVSIAPTSLFFDTQNRFSSLTVSNSGQQAQEVSISTEFGYPTSHNGNLTISRDSVLAGKKSLASWLKVFPQSFTLQPNQRQVVRFVVQPPQGLNTGGYWSRIKIASNPLSPPIEMTGNSQVGAQINLVVEQVIAAHYRTENAATNIRVTSVDFERYNGTGIISVSTEQTGNAPFMGSIQLEVTAPSGEVVYQTTTTTSVYTSITRTFRMNLEELSSGTYTISGTIVSDRRDIDSNNLLQINPVGFQKRFIID